MNYYAAINGRILFRAYNLPNGQIVMNLGTANQPESSKGNLTIYENSTKWKEDVLRAMKAILTKSNKITFIESLI